MVTALHPDADGSPSIRWSLYVGLYMFGCGIVTAFLLDELLVLLADVIGLPATYSLVVLASPTLIIGAATWWTIVERRKAYTYRLAGVFGLVTALLTGTLWTARFVSYWGFEMLGIPVVAFLAVFVLGVAGLAGVLSSLPLMYARRRLNRRTTGRETRGGPR